MAKSETENLKMWTDEFLNEYNTVYDNNNVIRPLTKLENYIVELCEYYYDLSPACDHIFGAKFEGEAYSADDLLQAAKDLLEKTNEQIDTEKWALSVDKKSLKKHEMNDWIDIDYDYEEDYKAVKDTSKLLHSLYYKKGRLNKYIKLCTNN